MEKKLDESWKLCSLATNSGFRTVEVEKPIVWLKAVAMKLNKYIPGGLINTGEAKYEKNVQNMDQKKRKILEINS